MGQGRKLVSTGEDLSERREVFEIFFFFFLSETLLETKLLPDIVQETHQTYRKVIIFRILHYPFTESYSSLVQYSPQCGLVVLV